MDAAQTRESLRAAGLKVTVPRVAVLDAVAEHPHSAAEHLHAELATTHPTLSIQSVHNVLRSLTDSGILRRIEPADSPALYERRVGDNHHHAVCRGCGSVRDIPCTVGHAPCLDPEGAGDFAVDLAEVVFWGLCADCRAHGIPMTTTPESPRRNHV
jgi:Fur family ferric uptake transcriptional regulator